MNGPVLVTGGAGYIGSHTCKALHQAGILPVTLDNLTLGHRWAVKWGPLEVAELLDTAATAGVMRKHDIKAVVHFAASAYVGDSMRDPAAYYRNNLLTTLSLMDAMRQVGVQTLLFSSSCSVYGNPVGGKISENHPKGPLSPYGQTKLDCENAISWYAAAYGMRTLSLRYFNAAGADPEGETGEDHDPETRLVPRAILAAVGAGPALQVFGTDYPTRDGTAIRDYIHVSDLAEAHVKGVLALQQGLSVQALNLGTGSGYSVLEVMSEVERATGSAVPHALVDRRAGDPAEVVADASLARSVLGWSPRLSDLAKITATAAAWHRKRLAR